MRITAAIEPVVDTVAPSGPGGRRCDHPCDRAVTRALLVAVLGGALGPTIQPRDRCGRPSCRGGGRSRSPRWSSRRSMRSPLRSSRWSIRSPRRSSRPSTSADAFPASAETQDHGGCCDDSLAVHRGSLLLVRAVLRCVRELQPQVRRKGFARPGSPPDSGAAQHGTQERPQAGWAISESSRGEEEVPRWPCPATSPSSTS